MRLIFNIIINKFQSQSLQNVGFYLYFEIFIYGQLYVAFNKIINKNDLLIMILGELSKR